MAVESIVNQALDLIGYKRHVGSIWDGTPAARIALDAWASSRDGLLEQRLWPWARAEVTLVSAGTDTPSRYTYKYPDDCAAVWQIKPLSAVTLDPQPVLWSEAQEGGERRLWTNVSDAVAVITAKVYDPDLWPGEFAELMVMRLAERFHTALGIAAPTKKQSDDAR